jgi:hypothetical protein
MASSDEYEVLWDFFLENLLQRLRFPVFSSIHPPPHWRTLLNLMLALNDDCLLVVFKFVVKDLQTPEPGMFDYLRHPKIWQRFTLAHINKRCRLAMLSSVRLCKLDQQSVEKNNPASLVDPYYNFFSV